MSKTLLLADDSSTIQRVVELTFAQEDIRVISVSDGEQALKSIDKEKPDIVLADVGMPRMDGYSVSSHVKTSAALQHIPVLLLTGAFEPVDEGRAKAAQCDGVLVKPFEPRALVTRVQELLNAARARREAAATPNGHDASAPAADPGHNVPSWYKADRPVGADRPGTPAIDAGNLDQGLAGLRHEPAATAPSGAASSSLTASPAPPTPAAAPEPLILDLGSFAPVHGSPPVVLDTKAPVPLDLGPMPAAAAPPPLVPELMPLPAEAAAADSSGAASPAPGAALSSKISLSTAFSALLAAEQSAPPGAAAPALADHALEDVVRRVLLNDKAVRKLVLDAAERMVKEEIERIKSGSESAEGEPGTE